MEGKAWWLKGLLAEMPHTVAGGSLSTDRNTRGLTLIQVEQEAAKADHQPSASLLFFFLLVLSSPCLVCDFT